MLTQERKKKLVNNVFIKGQLSRKYPLVVSTKSNTTLLETRNLIQ